MIIQFVKRTLVKKMAKKAIQLLVAFLVAHSVDSTLSLMGITIDWIQFEIFLTGFSFVVLEGLRNYLKVKFNLKFL